MKKLAILLALIALVTLLAACSAPEEETTEQPEQTVQTEETAQSEQTGLVGTWVGDGTMDIFGLDHEIEFVHTWTFLDDGSAIAEKTLDDGTEETLTYTYKYTEDTLTFIKDEATCAIGYTLEGDTLTIRTGVDTYAEFIRQ